MDNESFRRSLDNADVLRREGKYTEALNIVEGLLVVAPHSGDLLVRRGMLLQLVPEDGSLEDVENTLRTAGVCSPGNLDALIELGHFFYAVRCRNTEALEHFNAAIEKAKTALKEALIGQIKCHADLRDWDAADEALANAERHFPDDIDIRILRDECASDRNGA